MHILLIQFAKESVFAPQLTEILGVIIFLIASLWFYSLQKSFKAYHHFLRIVSRIAQNHLVNCCFYAFCSVVRVEDLLKELMLLRLVSIYNHRMGNPGGMWLSACLWSQLVSRLSENDLMLYSCVSFLGFGTVRVKTIFTVSYTFWVFNIMLSCQLWNEFWAVLKSQ